MTNNKIDQLAQWWETAEKGVAREGDTVIWRNQRHRSGTYAYEVGSQDRDEEEALPDDLRILSRAPKPKPAWHKARAVVAECKHDAPDQGRGTFINDRRGHWLDESGKRYVSADLTDVTPLIEAKVTDEMIDRAFRSHVVPHLSERELRELLTDVLGIEAE